MDVDITLKSGKRVTYYDIPDGVSPDEVEARAAKDHGEGVELLERVKAQQPEQPQPKQETLGGNVATMLGNAPKSAANAAVGLYETVTSPIQTIKALGDAAGGAVHKALPDSVNTFIQKFREPGAIAREIEAANAVGRHYKDRFGGDEAIKNTLMNDPVGLLLDVSGLGALGAGVARGAGSALRATPSNALRQAGAQAPKVADALTKISDATNPLVGVQKAARLPGWAIEKIGLNLTPRQRELAKSKLLNKVSDGDEAAVLRALDNPPKTLPGERVTAISAVADKVNAPAFVAAGDLVGDKYGAKVGRATKVGNEQARLGAVRTIGKDEATLKAATDNRAAQAKASYDQAYAQAVKADKDLLQIMGDPYVKTAWPDAAKVAEARGVNVQTNLLEHMHLVKLSLDKMLKKTGDSALGSFEKGSVKSAKSRLIDWMKSKSPDYDAARTQFAANSRPINQMEVGQYLEKKLAAPLQGAERPAAFANALSDAPTTIQRSRPSGRSVSSIRVAAPTSPSP